MIKSIIIICISLIIVFNYSCKTPKALSSNNTNINRQDTNSLVYFKGDTVAYIKNIVKNKAKYINKPLSVLLRDLEIPISSFGTNWSSQKGISRGVNLYPDEFSKVRNIGNSGGTEQLLILISLKENDSMDSIKAIYADNRAMYSDKSMLYPDYVWSPRAIQYFSSKIVADISLPYYMQ